jgi:hypothetical protein
MIFASEVPVIAKLNPYRKIEDVFYTVWNRTDPIQVLSIEKKLSLSTPEERMSNIIVESGASDVIEKAVDMSSKADSVEEINAVTRGLTSSIEGMQNVDDDVKRVLIDHGVSEVKQNYGKENESKAINHYEEKQKTKVSGSNLKFYKKLIGLTPQNREIWVGGRIDGEAGGRVIEVKNRTKRFMNPLPKYDICQLQTYLAILESPEGELVEHLRRKSNGGGVQTHSTIIARDNIMWQSEILPHLLKFGESLNAFMEQPDEQRYFLLHDEKEKREIMESYGLL